MKQQFTKRAVALALTVGVMAGLSAPMFAANIHEKFRDHQAIKWHWAHNAIETLTEKGILEGYETGYFRPNRYVTRAEFTNMLVKALGSNSRGESFNDVANNFWASQTIETAHGQQLAEGYPSGQFSPTRPINRAEVLTLLSKVTYGDTPSEEEARMIFKNYRDGNRIPEWARMPLAKVIDHDVFKSIPTYRYNVIHPSERVTRGEVAFLLDRLITHNEIAHKPEIEVYHSWTEVTKNDKIRFPERITHERTKPTYTTTVATPISSEFTRVGEMVTVYLDEAVDMPNGKTIPAGSRVVGRVKQVETAGLDRTGMVEIGFDEIVTPSNQTIRVSGVVGTSDGMLKGSSLEGLKRSSTSSYEELRARILSEAGTGGGRHQRGDVFYKEPLSVDDTAHKFIDKNKDNFVLVGVGDKLELKFTGAMN